MTTSSEDRCLSLVRDKTMNTVYSRLRSLSDQKDRTALRREFQGWFSKEWDELEILWLQHYQEWTE